MTSSRLRAPSQRSRTPKAQTGQRQHNPRLRRRAKPPTIPVCAEGQNSPQSPFAQRGRTHHKLTQMSSGKPGGPP